jgi:cytochrome c biogenesis protein CcmG, thiol:disulfide interchange protein DsbE
MPSTPYLRRFLIGALALVVTAVQAAVATEGKPMPHFQLKTLDGKSIDSADLKGKVVLVNFWATWCPPCREEMPAFQKYYEAHRGEGFEIVAVSTDEPEDLPKVREAMKPFSFPGAMQADNDTKPFGRIWVMPMSFVIDRGGIVRKAGWHSDKSVDEGVLDALLGGYLKAH